MLSLESFTFSIISGISNCTPRSKDISWNNFFQGRKSSPGVKLGRIISLRVLNAHHILPDSPSLIVKDKVLKRTFSVKMHKEHFGLSASKAHDQYHNCLLEKHQSLLPWQYVTSMTKCLSNESSPQSIFLDNCWQD